MTKPIPTSYRSAEPQDDDENSDGLVRDFCLLISLKKSPFIYHKVVYFFLFSLSVPHQAAQPSRTYAELLSTPINLARTTKRNRSNWSSSTPGVMMRHGFRQCAVAVETGLKKMPPFLTTWFFFMRKSSRHTMGAEKHLQGIF